MRRVLLALTLSALVAGPSVLLADSVPYSNIGVVPPSYTLTATTTGEIFLYLVRSGSTGTNDTVSFRDLTSGYNLPSVYQNNFGNVVPFSQYDLGFHAAGDVLVFSVFNPGTGTTLGSDASLNSDGINHAYIAHFGGGPIVGNPSFPAGLFIGLEDLPAANSDFNFNDVGFFVTNVTATPVSAVPEPSTFVLLGSGLLGAAGALKRRFSVR